MGLARACCFGTAGKARFTMAIDSSTPPEDNAPKATKRPRKVNLATAKVVDAALPAVKSVYEIVGLNDSAFGKQTFEQFQSKLTTMDLYSLQEMARKVGVVPTSKREVLVDRLERRFLQDRVRSGPPKAPEMSVNEDLRAQTLKILARGR